MAGLPHDLDAVVLLVPDAAASGDRSPAGMQLGISPAKIPVSL
jgi:hypothetical protein